MSAELTLGAEEELHLIDLESWQLSARAPQLLSRLPGDNYSAEIQRTTVETNTDVVDSLGRAALGAGPAAPRPGRGRRRRGTRHRLGRHRSPLGLRRLRADQHRSVRPDAGAVPAAGRRAADLRAADPRRRLRPRPGGGDHAAGRPATCPCCSPCRPARRSGTGRTPATRASARSSGSAGRAPARPDGSTRPQEYDELLDDLINTGVIADAQDGLLRRPALGARPDAGAAGLRRLPDRRRRGPDRRAVPGRWSEPPSTSIARGRAVRAGTRRRSTARRSGGPPGAG